jgi:ABC-type transporter lipoprotein component MlaA/pimeloyl-ACP methyl ester carboxylesterase
VFAATLLLNAPLLAAMQAEQDLAARTANAIILPEPIGDPIEPVNRALWALNQGLLKGAIQPSSKVYRAVVPADVRRGFWNAGRNLVYPRNLANNLLQQKWTGARDETYRFLLNSVAGIGGLFDVATESGIPAAEADFGQTLRDWGWRPRVYLMLPIFGPSNERDAVGGLADRLVSPLTYFSPYSYIPLGITYNNLTDTVDEYIRVAKSDFDPYFVLRYAWILRREARPVDLTTEGEPDVASLETLQSVFFKMQDVKFPEHGEKRRVEIAATGRQLPFTLWLQRGNAPLVFIVPGFGSHRLSGGVMALAELLYAGGFSVVSISSAFNYEFMERAAGTALPGYTPVDARDMHNALTEIDRNIRAKYPGRVTDRALLGYSMGGFHALYLAGTEETNDASLVKFDRYVAIDAPVRLDRAISALDDHFRAALDWRTEERTERIEDTFVKVAALASKLNTLTPDSRIPLNATESKFLVGLAFRISLRDVIFLSQSKTNLGVLKEPLNQWRREEVYREIFQFSFNDYLKQFVTPYYRTRGVDLSDAAEFERAVDLRRLEPQLKSNPKVRIIVNANDPVLGEDGLTWTQATFAKDRLTLFPRGGHLGNLNQTVVQREIIRALEDLLPPRPD